MALSKYIALLQDLLPRGFAWPRQASTNMESLLGAFAVELERGDARVDDMLRESYPLTSSELLEDWERVLGLPEPCAGAPTGLEARRIAAHEKLSRKGGQSPQYFIDLAAQYGFTITISEYSQFRAGINSAGDPVYGDAWAYTWVVHGPEVTVRTFKAGQATAGEALREWGNEILECLINRLKPAHTHVIFSYGEA